MTTRELYYNRINQAIDYINKNLSEKIRIMDICREACFSTYHFHRIFKSFMGESLYAYVTRLRVEKAATLLLTRKMSITRVANLVGFDDTATFARAFKKNFGLSASLWKKGKKSKIHQESEKQKDYIYKERHYNPTGICAEEISIIHKKEEKMIYIRHRGPFAGDYKLFLKLHYQLREELKKKSILWKRDQGYYAIYHDALGITKNDQLKLSYGVVSDYELNRDSHLGSLIIQANKYVLAHFKLQNHEYGKAWTQVYREIIPSLELEPCDGYCYENYKDDCYNKENGTTQLIIAIPVKKLL